MDEYEKYKIDKLIEYFKFIISAHVVLIGVVVTFREKFLNAPELNVYFMITIAFLFISYCIAILGYMSLVGSFFEQPKNHKAIATFARKYTGAILIASTYSFFFQSLQWP